MFPAIYRGAEIGANNNNHDASEAQTNNSHHAIGKGPDDYWEAKTRESGKHPEKIPAVREHEVSIARLHCRSNGMSLMQSIRICSKIRISCGFSWMW